MEMRVLGRCSIVCAFSLAMGCGDGGGDGGEVHLVGKSPEEQAHEMADAICQWEETCGKVTVDYTQDQNGLTCEGMVSEEGDYAECFAVKEPSYQKDFEDCGFSEEEEAIIEDCLNDLLGEDCITQDQIDQFCEDVGNGADPDEAYPQPESCQAADQLFRQCWDVGIG